jgi:hypothetical protein
MPFEQIEYFSEGCAAFFDGQSRNRNPYKPWCAPWVAWLTGWDDSAEAEGAEQHEPVSVD